MKTANGGLAILWAICGKAVKANRLMELMEDMKQYCENVDAMSEKENESSATLQGEKAPDQVSAKVMMMCTINHYLNLYSIVKMMMRCPKRTVFYLVLWAIIFNDFSHSACLAPQLEMGGWSRDRTRLADVLVPNWVLEACVTAGSAALAVQIRKHRVNDEKCRDLGWACIPLVVETYGCWGTEAIQALSRLATHLSTRRDLSNEQNTSKNEKIFYENKAKARARYKADPETKKASVRDTYKADPEKKKASVRDSYKADPEKKKASVRDSYNANAVSKRAAKRQRYQEGVKENRAAKRQRYQEGIEENRAAKRQRYQEGVEENRAAKRQRYQEGVEENRAANRRIYRGISATIKVARRSRYWKGRRTTTTTQRSTTPVYRSVTQN
eukprot:Em0001g3603a